jgi:hypothetical protein
LRFNNNKVIMIIENPLIVELKTDQKFELILSSISIVATFKPRITEVASITNPKNNKVREIWLFFLFFRIT